MKETPVSEAIQAKYGFTSKERRKLVLEGLIANLAVDYAMKKNGANIMKQAVDLVNDLSDDVIAEVFRVMLHDQNLDLSVAIEKAKENVERRKKWEEEEQKLKRLEAELAQEK